MIWIRWFVTPIAAIAAWLVVFFLGLQFDQIVGDVWCGHEAIRTYRCTLPEWLRQLNVGLFAGLAAIAVMVAAVFTAPRRTPLVVWTVYCLGSAAALYLSGFGRDIVSLTTSLSCGAATAIAVNSRWRRPPNQQ